jgi:threonine 3-dehydrogenase
MRAVYKSDRKKGIKIEDLPVPEIANNEVLVEVKAAAVCGTDIHLYNWNEWCENVNAKNPMVIGHEFCGKVVEIGSDVLSIKRGDLIAAETHIPCGVCMMCKTGKQHICQSMKIIGVHTDGAFAEYAKLPEICAWRLPDNTPPEIGAVYEPFGIAVHGVLKDIVGGCSTLVMGCGPIGLFAVNVASVCGASKIFAVDINEYRLKIAQNMGDNIILINSSMDDLIQIVKRETGGIGVDVMVEFSGSPQATKLGFKALRKGGRVSLIGLHPQNVDLDLVNDVIYKEATIYGITGREMFDTWYSAEKLIASGQMKIKRVITHTFPLEETEKAILLAMGGKCGKAIIKI